MTPTQRKAKALNINLDKRTYTTLPYCDYGTDPLEWLEPLRTFLTANACCRRTMEAKYDPYDDGGLEEIVLVAYVPKSDAELQTEIEEAEAQKQQSDARERAEYERLRKKYGQE